MLKDGDTVTFWRDCPDCNGRGALIINPMVPDINRLCDPSNWRQCPRCVEEMARVDVQAS